MPLTLSRWSGVIPAAALTLLFAVLSLNNLFEQQRNAFMLESTKLVNHLERALHESEELLLAVAALYRSSNEVGTTEFQDLVHIWLDLNPHILGIGVLDWTPDAGFVLRDSRFHGIQPETWRARLSVDDSFLNHLLIRAQESESLQWKAVFGQEPDSRVFLAMRVDNLEAPAENRVILTEIDPARLLDSIPFAGSGQLLDGNLTLARLGPPDGPIATGTLRLKHHHTLMFGDHSLTLDTSSPMHYREMDNWISVTGFLIFIALLYSIIRVIRNTRFNARILEENNREIAARVEQQTRDLRRYATDLEQLRNALDQHSIVSVTDVRGTIIQVNRKFIDVSGYSREELIGNTHRILKSGLHDDAFYEDIWSTISRGETWQGEICNRNRNGELYWVSSSIVPLLDEHGIPYRYISIRTDITPLKRVEQALRDNEARLRRSQIFANIGTWDWNIRSGDLFWSERIAALFGYEPGEQLTTYDHFLECVHPDDRRHVDESVEACIAGGQEYDIEHRVIWPDGSVRWMLERGDVVRSEDGSPLHMLGVVQDITERKQLEFALADRTAMLTQLHDAMSYFVASSRFSDVAELLLRGLLKATDSGIGLIGEVRRDEQGATSLLVHAISDVAWDEESRDMYQALRRSEASFPGLDNLLGAAIRERRVVISNTPRSDPLSRGLPAGHPRIDHFAGVPIYYGDELLGVYAIANRPGGYDEAMIAELAAFNATLSVLIYAKRIREREKQSQVDLLAAKEMAERANRAKSDFLSRMSHELRTPMNAILGFSQLLAENLDGNLSKSEQDFVREILNAGQHLLELINEILDLTRIESGKISLSLEPVAVGRLVEECKNLLLPLAAQRSIGISLLPCSIDGVHVMADRMRLKEILLNLISNAIKYNRDGGHVTIRARRLDSGKLRLYINDTGIGITRERQYELFEPFNRLEAEDSGIEGTGIGLVIARRLIHLMNGDIGFKSDAGIGSSFWVEIPLADEVSTTKQEEEPAGVVPAGKPSGLILYVDDNPSNLHLMEEIFERRGDFRVITASSSSLGLELAATNRPDCILLDINMPDMDGYTLFQRLREHPELADIPIVALSGDAGLQQREKALGLGFSAYLVKPLNIPLLQETLEDLLTELYPPVEPG